MESSIQFAGLNEGSLEAANSRQHPHSKGIDDHASNHLIGGIGQLVTPDRAWAYQAYVADAEGR